MIKKNVLVSGANGHMGQIVCELVEKSEIFNLSHAFDKTLPKREDCICCTNLDDIDSEDFPDIIIDFSAPDATMELLSFAGDYNIPIVIATTGFSEEQLALINESIQWLPIFMSANMSVEVCLIKKVLQLISPKLNGSDIEILETHHNRKKDAPSGTALMLANAIKDSLSEEERKLVYGRAGKREANEIGISALRGGNIVGEHSVFFFGESETLEIKHTAHSRNLFAEGALKAAEFLCEQEEPGLYTMDDLLSM